MLFLTEFISNNPILAIVIFVIVYFLTLYGYTKIGILIEEKNTKIFICIILGVVILFLVFLIVNPYIADYMLVIIILIGLVYAIVRLAYLGITNIISFILWTIFLKVK